VQRFRLPKLSLHPLPPENVGEGYEEFEKTFKSEKRTQSRGRTAPVLNGDRQEEAGLGAPQILRNAKTRCPLPRIKSI
jgi:hypothetical protein